MTQTKGSPRNPGRFSAGRYAGRKPDTKMHERVIALKSGGCSIAETARLAGVSVSQVKRVWAQNQTKDKV